MVKSVDRLFLRCKHPPGIEHEGEVCPDQVGEGQETLIDLESEGGAHDRVTWRGYELDRLHGSSFGQG